MLDFKVTEDQIEIFDKEFIRTTTIWMNFASYKIDGATIEAFLHSLVAHVVYVREAGRRIGVSEHQLAEHDLSKFSIPELPHYARNFFGDKADPDGFAGAWLHHIHQNEHHWQHWIFPDGFAPKGSAVENGVVEMPERYALEMIADWQGASKAYTGSDDMSDWLSKNIAKIRVHSKTAVYLRGVLDGIGYADIVQGQKFAGEESNHVYI